MKKPQEALEQIRRVLLLMRGKDADTAHKLAAALFQPVDVLAVIDARLSNAIKGKLVDILSLAEPGAIQVKIDEIRPILVQLNLKLTAPTPLKTYLGVSIKQYLGSYIKARRQYQAYLKALDKLERDILDVSGFDKKLHEPMKHGKYQGYLHARLTDNLRVLYFVDRKKTVAIFVDILAKNELDKA